MTQCELCRNVCEVAWPASWVGSSSCTHRQQTKLFRQNAGDRRLNSWRGWLRRRHQWLKASVQQNSNHTVKISVYPRIFCFEFSIFGWFRIRSSSVDGIMKRVFTLQICNGPGSLFRRFTDTNVYATGSVKMWKTRHKISVDIRIFLQCSSVLLMSLCKRQHVSCKRFECQLWLCSLEL